MSRYVEEYEVGKPFPLSPGRTISEADINLFAGLVGDFTPTMSTPTTPARRPSAAASPTAR